MPLAWVPYADRAEAERRLNGIPAGLELDFYRADGDELPRTIDEVAFYVLPYMKGPAVLERAGDVDAPQRSRVVQALGHQLAGKAVERLPVAHGLRAEPDVAPDVEGIVVDPGRRR